MICARDACSSKTGRGLAEAWRLAGIADPLQVRLVAAYSGAYEYNPQSSDVTKHFLWQA